MDELKTVDEVIASLGGIKAVSRLVGLPEGSRAAWNWRRRGLPPESYVVIQEALAQKGLSAPPSLFGMYERSCCA